MALTLSKLFMRTISQNPNENQTGISLWTLEDIERHQAKQREVAMEVTEQQQNAMDDEDDYGDGGLDDSTLAQIVLDV
jgi:DNA excision repair protein ERCC-2